ncbi:hypothetical protein GCM10020255_058010 [Rhodococcus baikonurensis]
MAYVQEGKRVFHKQTVEQNLLLGGYTRKVKRSALMESVESMYEMFPILGRSVRFPQVPCRAVSSRCSRSAQR